MKPATQQQQQQQRTGENEMELDLLLTQDTVELVNGGEELVSLEDGDWCVGKKSGGLGEKEVKNGMKLTESDKIHLLTAEEED